MTNERDPNQKNLILPSRDGVQNLEIRRIQRALEAERQDPSIHPQTAGEVTRKLEELMVLVDRGKVRALVTTALLQDHPKDSR